MWTNQIRLTLCAFLIFSLSACGGARSPGKSDAASAVSVSSNHQLSWIPPTSYTDETPLGTSDIAGYQIYVGTTKYNMKSHAKISGSDVTSIKLDTLGKGIRYIAVTCYDTVGIESSLSSILIVDII